jgi:hypothetical protein
MNRAARLRSFLRGCFRRSQIERDMDSELRLHIEQYTEDLVRGGLPAEEARRRAGAAVIDGSAELVTGELVSGDFYQGVGVSTVAGRPIGPADDTDSGAVAVISDGFWLDDLAAMLPSSASGSS